MRGFLRDRLAIADLVVSTEVIATLLGTVVGALLMLAVEWIKLRLFSGKLRASFDTGKRVDFLAEMDSPPSAWVRVLVENTKKKSLARGCRAYLTQLTWRSVAGAPQTTPVGDSLPLRWSNTADATVVDIPYGVNQFVDVISVLEQQPNCLRLETIPPKISICFYRDLRINFEITVISDARSPITQRGCIHRKPGRAWNDIEISSDCSAYDLEVGHGQ